MTPTTTTSTRVAVYLRVSSDEQAERDTIDAQRHFFTTFVELYQLPVFDTYQDNGVSGTIPLGERPEGRRLLQDAEAGCFRAVLVYRVDRLGRSLDVLLHTYNLLSRFHVTIRSATEPFDTDSPLGRFMFQLLSSMAELEKSTILERMSLGKARVARQGKWTNGPVPYGYTVDAESCLAPSARLVDVVSLTEAEVVRDLYQRMAAGSTAITEARRLNALGVPTLRYSSNGMTRKAGQWWYPSRIGQIISSDVYRDTHVFHSRHGAIERDVPPLVDARLWEQANAVLKGNKRLPKGNQTRTYLLRGLIVCGRCGAHYIGQSVTRRSGKQDLYYRCGSRSAPGDPERDGRCYSEIVDAAWLEQLVWSDCRRFILDPGAALAEAQRQLQERQQHGASAEQERQAYLAALTEKALEKDRIIAMSRRGMLPLDDADTQLQDIAREEAELRAQLSAMDAQRALADAFASHVTDARQLLERLRERLATIEASQDEATKRQVVELLVQHIRIDTPDGVPHGTTRGSTPYTVTITYTFAPIRFAENGTSLPGI